MKVEFVGELNVDRLARELVNLTYKMDVDKTREEGGKISNGKSEQSKQDAGLRK